MKYGTIVTLCLFLCGIGTTANFKRDNCPNIKTSINSMRKRRYIAFPDDSAATITISLAKAFPTHVPSGWYMTTDLDVLYPLPDHKFVAALARRKMHHRQKKDMWDRLKATFDLHNFNGHACILRSICEAKVHLAPPGRSLVHDMIRAIFTSPTMEEEFQEVVKDTYSEVLDPSFCEHFHDCPFSIIKFMLAFKKTKH